MFFDEINIGSVWYNQRVFKWSLHPRQNLLQEKEKEWIEHAEVRIILGASAGIRDNWININF